jgi:hypothetical protein
MDVIGPHGPRDASWGAAKFRNYKMVSSSSITPLAGCVRGRVQYQCRRCMLPSICGHAQCVAAEARGGGFCL